MSSDLRVALIGYGFAGRIFHAPLIAATDGLALTTVVTSDPGRATAASQAFPDARVLPSVDDLWAARNDVDLVVVASPNAAHPSQVSGAVQARLPVVVDKPMAATAEAAERVVLAAERAGVLFSVFQNRRWDSDYLTVRSLLAAERLGTVHRFESRMERWEPTLSGNWREFADPAAGGGVLLDLGAHVVDQAVQLFGQVESVYADTGIRRRGASVDDDAFVILQHRSGVASHLGVGVTAASAGPRFRVLGSRAAFFKSGIDIQEEQSIAGVLPTSAAWGIEPPERWGTLSDSGGAVVVPSSPGGYVQFYAAVRDAVRDGGRPPVEPRDSLRVLRLIEAARRSSTSRTIITVDEEGHAVV